jgi:protein phosphatase
MSEPDEVATEELSLSPDQGRQPPPPFSSLVRVDFDGLSHPGRVRPNNEDHFLTCRYGRHLEPLRTNLPAETLPSRFEETGYGMVVADGVGGSAAGEVASRLAIHILVNLVLHTPDWILRLEEEGFAQEVRRRAAERVGQVNRALAAEAEGDPGLRGFGTTLTLAWSVGKDLFVAHLGDSRAYLLRQGTLHQLTRDHSLAQELADRGLLSQQAVATHRLRHVLTRSLGDHGKDFRPDVQQLVLEDGDCLLLCTDGLTDMVPDATIAAILGSGERAAEVCRRLLDQALEAGGKDNVTVVVARYRLPSP